MVKGRSSTSAVRCWCVCVLAVVIVLVHAPGASAASCSTVLNGVFTANTFATDSLQCMASPFPLDSTNNDFFVVWVCVSRRPNIFSLQMPSF